MIKIVNEQEEVQKLLLTAFWVRILVLKVPFYAFWNEVSVSFPKREGRNKPNGRQQKNLAIFEDEKPSREWQIHFLKKRTEDPEGSPFSFLYPHNI